MRKKITAIILSGVLAVSCLFTGCGNEKKGSGAYIDIHNYQNMGDTTPTPAPTGTPKPGATDPAKPSRPAEENSLMHIQFDGNFDYGDDFDKFLDCIYVKLVTSDSLTLHFGLEEPEKYGIVLDYTLGVDEDEQKENNDEFFEYLAKGIEHFKGASLNEYQRIKYEMIEYESQMYERGKNLKTDFIVSSLSQNGNILSSLQTNFSEYPILAEKDMKDYIELLKLVPSVLERQGKIIRRQVVEDNLILTQDMLDNAFSVANNWYVNEPKDSVLYIAFESNAKAAGLSDSVIKPYLSELATILKEEIDPAITNFETMLNDFINEVDADQGLGMQPGGKEYYEYLMETNLNTGMSVDEIFEYGMKKYNEIIEKEEKLLSGEDGSGQGLYFKYISAKSKYGSDPEKVMDSLKENSKELFPDIGEIDLTLSYLDKRQENSLITAYYMPPQLDRISRKTIRVNKSAISDDIELYSTLAHEGIPGHLYQDAYSFQDKNYVPINSSFTYLGYQEGWAMYVEKLAFHWCLEDEGVAEIYNCENASSYLLSALADIKINYYGASKQEFATWICELAGLDIKHFDKDFYNIFVSDPALYPAYGLGRFYIEDTVNALIAKGNSEQEAYHMILEKGQLPFSVLWKELGINM